MGKLLIGMDEAGMGTLAGPMTAALVIIDDSAVPKGVRDSKTFSDQFYREEVAAKIMTAAIFYKVEARTAEQIDTKGISQCWEESMQALAHAASPFLPSPGFKIVLDGNRYVPFCGNVVPIVKADATHPAVSAASILAKYTQCCWMDDYELMYPRYGFGRHRGYGTADHLRMLKELGPCPIHRKSYKPVKSLLSL